MAVKPVPFHLLARCTMCDWHIRTQVKAEFDRAVKAHQAVHQ